MNEPYSLPNVGSEPTVSKLNPLYWREKRQDIRGWVLFSKVWGSWSHDTQLPASDVDYTGVYVAYTGQLMGLNPPPETLSGEKPDYQIHELRKFCTLLLKGNPGIIEMLFTDRHYWFDPKWLPLWKERRRFLTERVVKQYIGYSMAQLERLRKGRSVHSHGGVPNEKWAYHMVRVAWDAERIAGGNEPMVWKVGAEKDSLMDIRNGRMSVDRAMETVDECISHIDAMKPWDVHAEPDEDFLNKWLLWVRGIIGWEPVPGDNRDIGNEV